MQNSVYHDDMHTEVNESQEIVEPTVPVESNEMGNIFSFDRYSRKGGRVAEADYLRVMGRAREESSSFRVDPMRDQTAATVGVVNRLNLGTINKLSLSAIKDRTGVDPRCVYQILRSDMHSADEPRVHTSLSDQELLVEALLMLDQDDAVGAVKETHRNIFPKSLPE